MALFTSLGGFVSILLEKLHQAKSRVEAYAQEMCEQRERFRVTLTSIGDAVIATDAAGRVTLLNAVAQALTGWKEDEAVGQPFEQVFRIVHEQSNLPVETPVQRVLQTGRVVGLANHTALLSRSGARIPIDDSAAPIRAADAGISGVVLVFRDITQRARHEQIVRFLADASAALVGLVD
jgi:PAS domain S-box-containing protein